MDWGAPSHSEVLTFQCENTRSLHSLGAKLLGPDSLVSLGNVGTACSPIEMPTDLSKLLHSSPSQAGIAQPGPTRQPALCPPPPEQQRTTGLRCIYLLLPERQEAAHQTHLGRQASARACSSPRLGPTNIAKRSANE